MQKSLKIIAAFGAIACAGKKIWKDKRIDTSDTVFILPLAQKVPEYIEDFKAYKEAWAEVKAINVTSGVVLVQAIDAQVKLFEQA